MDERITPTSSRRESAAHVPGAYLPGAYPPVPVVTEPRQPDYGYLNGQYRAPVRTFRSTLSRSSSVASVEEIDNNREPKISKALLSALSIQCFLSITTLTLSLLALYNNTKALEILKKIFPSTKLNPQVLRKIAFASMVCFSVLLLLGATTISYKISNFRAKRNLVGDPSYYLLDDPKDKMIIDKSILASLVFSCLGVSSFIISSLAIYNIPKTLEILKKARPSTQLSEQALRKLALAGICFSLVLLLLGGATIAYAIGIYKNIFFPSKTSETKEKANNKQPNKSKNRTRLRFFATISISALFCCIGVSTLTMSLLTLYNNTKALKIIKKIFPSTKLNPQVLRKIAFAGIGCSLALLLFGGITISYKATTYYNKKERMKTGSKTTKLKDRSSKSSKFTNILKHTVLPAVGFVASCAVLTASLLAVNHTSKTLELIEKVFPKKHFTEKGIRDFATIGAVLGAIAVIVAASLLLYNINIFTQKIKETGSEIEDDARTSYGGPDYYTNMESQIYDPRTGKFDGSGSVRDGLYQGLRQQILGDQKFEVDEGHHPLLVGQEQSL